MYWSNVFRRASSDFSVNDNLPGTFVNFRLKIFSQEELGPMMIHASKIFNRKVSFKCRCQSAS